MRQPIPVMNCSRRSRRRSGRKRTTTSPAILGFELRGPGCGWAGRLARGTNDLCAWVDGAETTARAAAKQQLLQSHFNNVVHLIFQDFSSQLYNEAAQLS